MRKKTLTAMVKVTLGGQRSWMVWTGHETYAPKYDVDI